MSLYRPGPGSVDRPVGDQIIGRGRVPPRSRPPRWHALAAAIPVLVVLGALLKVAGILMLARVDLAAAHAGWATQLMIYGTVVVILAFAMRWTAWDFGLSQVLWEDLYEDLGYWLYRVGFAAMLIGTPVSVIGHYLL